MPFAFLGTGEIAVILVIALLIFGPTKLPEVGRQIAMAMREMRKMSSEVQRVFDLDDYRYDNRFESPGHDPAASPEWSPGADGEVADEGAPVEGARPWSLAEPDGTEPGAGEGEPRGVEPVTTAEPPGPPSRHETV